MKNNETLKNKVMKISMATTMATTILLGGVPILDVSIPVVYAEENVQAPQLGHDANRQQKSGLVMDVKTGEVIFNQDGEIKAYPASITKIITAILLDEHVKDGEKITISKKAASEYPSNQIYHAKEGEEVTKDQAMMLLFYLSANDICMAVAEKVGGSPEKFGEMMTAKAKELGASNTNFVTPNGLHDPNHYVTAKDMATITREAMKHDAVKKYMFGKDDVFLETNKSKVNVFRRDRVFEMPNALGGKTGYTDEAGNTLVSVHKQGEKEIITVVMQANKSTQYSDSKKLADYGFPQMKETEDLKVVEPNKVIARRELMGKKVDLVANENYSLQLIKGVKPEFSTKIVSLSNEQIEKNVKVKKGKDSETKSIPGGTTVAILEVYQKDNKIKEIPLMTKKDVSAVSSFDVSFNELNGTTKWIIILSLPLVLIGLANVMKSKKRNRRKLQNVSNVQTRKKTNVQPNMNYAAQSMKLHKK
ncbi:D-alanyl-D-alanine carboxypeptidase family protein [Bacillus cereus]